MTKPTEMEAGPGEMRAKKRVRGQIVYVAFGAVLGGVIGFLTGFFDQGDGNLFAGDWDKLALDPILAIGLAVFLLIVFLALPLWGFSMLDDYQRENNYIAFTGGCLSVLASFPVWAVLYAGGYAPAPHAFGIFAIAYFSMIVAYLYARFKM